MSAIGNKIKLFLMRVYFQAGSPVGNDNRGTQYRCSRPSERKLPARESFASRHRSIRRSRWMREATLTVVPAHFP
jgi:hypothetical protein